MPFGALPEIVTTSLSFMISGNLFRKSASSSFVTLHPPSKYSVDPYPGSKILIQLLVSPWICPNSWLIPSASRSDSRYCPLNPPTRPVAFESTPQSLITLATFNPFPPALLSVLATRITVPFSIFSVI